MDDNNKSFYELLNVDKNCSLEEIKRQYKLLALKHHPDRNNGDDILFKKIQNAYETLSDPEKRYKYDSQQLSAGECVMDMNMFFDNIFSKYEEQQKIVIKIDLDNILYGCYKEYKVKTTDLCTECKGTGIFEPNKNTIRCRECFGKGVNPVIEFLSCITCNGMGVFVLNNKRCNICNGEKTINRYKEYKIYLKPGTNNNEIISISQSIILLIEHNYEEDIKFDNMDIHIDLEFTLIELLCGFMKEIIFSREYYLVQSKKVFDFNKLFNIKRKGINEEGDLYIHFKLIIDTDNLIYDKIGRSLNILTKNDLQFSTSSDNYKIINIQ